MCSSGKFNPDTDIPGLSGKVSFSTGVTFITEKSSTPQG
jgi:hypothetical protein